MELIPTPRVSDSNPRMELPQRVQDPLFPPDWTAWQTAGDEVWHARPPGVPNLKNYVHGTDKQECADAAWLAHRRMMDSK